MAIPTTQTTYFGFGSNLWLEQMHIRCPSSTYIGLARLNNYKWIINDRGYANVVELPSSQKTSTSPFNSSAEDYSTVVYGMVYTLTPTDEAQLDKNEGVPVAYTKELLECDFWSADPESPLNPIDTTQPPSSSPKMLVYIDRQRVTPSKPRDEYVYRMNQGIRDALMVGVPKRYVEQVMREHIPEDEREGRKSLEELARGQARMFKDESGVFGDG